MHRSCDLLAFYLIRFLVPSCSSGYYLRYYLRAHSAPILSVHAIFIGRSYAFRVIPVIRLIKPVFPFLSSTFICVS